MLADALDDPDTRACVTAERVLLAELEAGCAAPVGALAEVVEEEDGSLALSLRAFVGTVDGAVELRRSILGPVEQAARLGDRLARDLLDDGARELVEQAAESRPPDPSSGAAAPPLATPVPDSSTRPSPLERDPQ